MLKPVVQVTLDGHFGRVIHVRTLALTELQAVEMSTAKPVVLLVGASGYANRCPQWRLGVLGLFEGPSTSGAWGAARLVVRKLGHVRGAAAAGRSRPSKRLPHWLVVRGSGRSAQPSQVTVGWMTGAPDGGVAVPRDLPVEGSGGWMSTRSPKPLN